MSEVKYYEDILPTKVNFRPSNKTNNNSPIHI